MSLPLPKAKKSLEKRPSAKRFSLPVAALPAVLIAPLLMSAASSPAIEDSISATCSLEETATYRPEQTEGANAAYRQAPGAQTQAAPQSENGLTSFVRDRWNSVRRLIRENPYFTNGTPEQQAQAEALCLAQIRADYELLLAQASGGDPMPIWTLSEALPDLGATPSDRGSNSQGSNSQGSNSQGSNGRGSNGRGDRPEATPVIQPKPTAPAQVPVQTPIPAPVQTTPSVDPATLPTAQDPSIYMGPEFEPTPFDGIVIRTLSDMPDGNYRYIAGAAEERAYSDEELRQRGGSVFVLKKVGDRVTGDLLPRMGLPGICVTGTVSGDMIAGAAYPYDTTDTLQDSARQIGDNYEPYGSGALKIRQTQAEGDRLYYASALLDLTAFTPINAGSSLPPTSCQAGRTGGRDQE